MANTGGFILPDFAGAYRSGVEWGQEQSERKRRQPMVEQLEQLTLEKTKQGISLQDFALKEKQRKQQREDIADISKMAGWVMSQPPEQRLAAWNQAIDFRVSEGDTEAENYRSQWSDQFGDMLANMNPDDVMAAKYTTPLIENVGTMDKPVYRAVQYSQTGGRKVHEESTPLTPYEKSFGSKKGGIEGAAAGKTSLVESGDPFAQAELDKVRAEASKIARESYQQASKDYEKAVRIDDLIGGAEDLLNSDLDSIYGIEERAKLFRLQESTDLLRIKNNLLANLKLGEVDKLKGTGPITENEQRMLAEAATVLLEPDISPELARREMNKILSLLKRKRDEFQADTGASESAKPVETTKAAQDLEALERELGINNGSTRNISQGQRRRRQ